MYVSRTMQNHCGELKSGTILNLGLSRFRDLKKSIIPQLAAGNPHELIRTLEVLNILTNAEMIIHACLARKASSKYLQFNRTDYPQMDPPEWYKFLTVQLENNAVKIGEKPINYYGSFEKNYEMHNKDYLKGEGR